MAGDAPDLQAVGELEGPQDQPGRPDQEDLDAREDPEARRDREEQEDPEEQEPFEELEDSEEQEVWWALLAARGAPPPSAADLQDPGEQVAWARAAQGPAAATALATLDLSAVDDAGVLEAVAAAERVIAYGHAMQAEALAVWGRRHGAYEHPDSDDGRTAR